MRTVIYIFFPLFLFCATNLNAQRQIQIDTLSFCYFNGITGQTQTISKYQITNKSNSELVHDFFKKKKGDFSFIEMMFEDLSDEHLMNVGYSFIKKIAPGKTFSYFIAQTDRKSKFYQERIVLMKKREVEQYLRIQIDEKYFFKLPSIFLVEQ